LIIMTPRVLRTKEDADILKQVESARMSWCLADVIRIHGESGLRGRNADWTDAETTVVYPEFAPEMLNSVIPGAEEIVTPPPGAGPTPALPLTTPPTTPPPGAQLPPPTSVPPVQPGTPALRIPMDATPGDAPPMLPSADSGARLQQPASPTVKGPLSPVARQAALLPLGPPHATPVHSASHTEAARGSFYASPASPPAPSGVQQAIYQSPQGNNQQALFELPVR
jgi:hypothetical protein